MNGSQESVDGVTDYEDYEDSVVAQVWPTPLEWASVPLFAVLLLLGLAGNLLVVVVVARNAAMRTVTNIFLVNLALADFLVLLICLPVTVLWDITKTWWFGTTLCKITCFLQNLSVTVSVLTLVCISVERWYAICSPLRFKGTMERTLRCLAGVWCLGLLLSLPDPITLKAFPHTFERPNFTTTWATQCKETWPTGVQYAYQFLQTLFLFFLPLSIIAILYGNISYHLWVKALPPTESITCPPSGTTVRAGWLGGKVRSPCPGSGGEGGLDRRRSTVTSMMLDRSMDREVLSRRKAAKMLILVVLLFTLCYFPVHLFNILKYSRRPFGVFDGMPQNATVIIRMLCRFLTYLNSSINPVIYNFMCEKFQREFRRVFRCRSSHAQLEATATCAYNPTTERSQLIKISVDRSNGQRSNRNSIQYV